jgi:hypothetical protein
MRHCLGFELLFEIMISEPACTAIDVYVYSDVGVGYECCETTTVSDSLLVTLIQVVETEHID